MQLWRGRDAYKIDVIAADGLAPVVGKMLDPKFLSRCLCVLDTAARDRNDLCAVTCPKSRDLDPTRKTGPDDAYTDRFSHTYNLTDTESKYNKAHYESFETRIRPWNRIEKYERRGE